ncbi:MAG: hypothetical protein JWN44_2006 [Myxococcales bacterium]|nr:hypothetical protein [Myxococcales bacterium]
MRAVVGCAIVSVWLAIIAGRAEGRLPVPKFGEASCEEQCRTERSRDDSSCDTGPLFSVGDRALCHEAVRARHDVCLRICED